METQAKPRITPEEYLRIERHADVKHEFLNGEMFAMSGASPTHVMIAANIVAALHPQLRHKSCSVYSTDLRVKVKASGLYTYPDVVVACGNLEFDDEIRDTVLNPTLIMEVLSESTKDCDRGGKFEHYRKLESLREYVLVAQDECHVEHFVRQPDDRWLLSETNNQDDILTLGSISCQLNVRDVYEKVDLASAAARIR
jgi:Uma2 family endonuclease